MDDKPLTKKERRKLARENKRLEREKKEKATTLRKYITRIVIIGLLVFGGYKSWVWVSTPIPGSQPTLGQPNVAITDQVKGNPEATLTLVEYSDFQCPACKSYYPIANQLVDEFEENIRFVYKHFPLVSIHPNAFDAARAAEAAGKAGKFWEMHNILFERQDDWANERNPENKFIGYAKELEILEEAFKLDYDSDDVEARVRSTIAEGNSLGVDSTPSFYLNGAKVTNPQGYEQFKSLIEQNLEIQEQNLPTVENEAQTVENE